MAINQKNKRGHMQRSSESATQKGPEFSPHAQAFGATFGEIWKSISGMTLPTQAVVQLRDAYVQQSTELWNTTLKASAEAGAKAVWPLDKRFAAPDWSTSASNAYTAQMYLLNARTLLQMADTLQGDEKTKQRIRFAVQQWVDATAPSNYLALNPEAQRKAFDTQGESITNGVKQLLRDVQQGYVSQTDESAFEIGRNVATTPGTVVFENPLFQLIEYAPLTPKVFERPMLLVPPCINKYYILDLQPENSLIRHTVAQGHRVFVVSWRNPDASLKHTTWDHYVGGAVMRAIEVVQAISGSEKINTLGFCVGGTLLANALAVLAARDEKPAASLTLLTTLLDFSHTGVLDIFVDETVVQMREITLGLQSPSRGGLLKGQELASTFSALRPNDLLWNYVVGNYLKGETPPAFDLLYWNSDGTNLPGPMYCWYLRNTYLENNLAQPGKVEVCGEKVDLRQIDIPTYVYGSKEDHIVPWESAYRSTQVLKKTRPRAPKTNQVRFVLGASGHIAGVINPPAKARRSYWVNSNATLPEVAQDWFDAAQEHPGSWWTDWSAWLAGQGGDLVAAPQKPGSRDYPALEPAPGRYVKQKASVV
jgi:polyhydroxyalkanoate synthase subunit PhaC